MQEKEPYHTATITREVIKNRVISITEWPPYSPDLNSIEHIYEEMKGQVLYLHLRSESGKQRSHDELRIMVKKSLGSRNSARKFRKAH